MTIVEDQYGRIDISQPLAGVQNRNTDALECLLSMCRVLGLKYDITQGLNGRYHIRVTWTNWPTDYHHPHQRSGSCAVIGQTDLVQGLRAVMIRAVQTLKDNGNEFGRGFKALWQKDQGFPWGEDLR